MTAPTSPYATSAAVAYMLQVGLFQQSDFTVDTTPSKDAVDQILTWVSSQVDLQFQMAGYKVPFEVLSGESWPMHQTNYLGLITVMGAAAFSGGHTQRPHPALDPGRRGGTGNLHQDLFNAELRKIFDGKRTYLRFRAGYYHQTPAEMALADFKGPTTDFMEGKFDPQMYLDVYDVADRIVAVQEHMKWRNISWDYLYSLFSLEKGLGTTVQELAYWS